LSQRFCLPQQDDNDAAMEEDIERAASKVISQQTPDEPNSVPLNESGLRAWVREARAAKPPRAELKRRSDMFLKEFEAREQEERQMREANEERMDADGFTVVKYSKSAKRRKDTSDASSGVSLLPPTKSASGGRGGREGGSGGRQGGKSYNHRKAGKDGFMYSFQVRQAREDRLEKLKLAFEEDKAKVQRLKQARRFKPV
jgi:ribosomal RNA-processing protein 7